MLWFAKRLWASARAGDWREVGNAVSFSAHERFHEWWLGIDSSGFADADELGIVNDLFHAYEPTDYRTLREILRRLAIRPGEDVLLDLGAGKGRVVIVAATYPFRAVWGVELSPELAAAAQENVQRARRRMKCQHVNIVAGDATTFEIPDDVTIVFLFNPFRGQVLTQVLDNIQASLARRDRPLRIAFLNPRYFEFETYRDQYPWLEKLLEFSPPPGKLLTAIYGNSAARRRGPS